MGEFVQEKHILLDNNLKLYSVQNQDQNQNRDQDQNQDQKENQDQAKNIVVV